MTDKRYSLAFTTGGLYVRESVQLADVYLDSGNWSTVRHKVLSENLLQTRTLNTAKRTCREILTRLKELSYQELEFLVRTNTEEQGYLLWMAVCRRYTFIAEFAVEVLRERYLSLKMDLSPEDFAAFFHWKSEIHEELESIQPTTRKKLGQVLFKIMREAGLLTVDNTIRSALLSSDFFQVLPPERRQDMCFFPTQDFGRQETVS